MNYRLSKLLYTAAVTVFIGAFIALAVAFALAAPTAKTPEQRYLELVTKRHGMLETGGYNRGPFIDRANRKYAYLGAPYCASGGSYDLDSLKTLFPMIRSGASRRFVTSESVDARKVWRKSEPVPVPSIGVCTRKGGGHYIYIYRVRGDTLFGFEYNSTPNGKRGSQHDGRWSGFKTRMISSICAPTNPFRITHFTPVVLAPGGL